MQFLTIHEFSKSPQNALLSDKERSEAFERLMKFPRKKVPRDFDYKKELMEAIDERFGSVN